MFSSQYIENIEASEKRARNALIKSLKEITSLREQLENTQNACEAYSITVSEGMNTIIELKVRNDNLKEAFLEAINVINFYSTHDPCGYCKADTVDTLNKKAFGR